MYGKYTEQPYRQRLERSFDLISFLLIKNLSTHTGAAILQLQLQLTLTRLARKRQV